MSKRATLHVTTVSRVYLIVALFVALILCLVLLFQCQMDASAAIRAYVGGEGLWAKAQKDAIRNLEHYAVSRDEADYQIYWHLIQVPLGDRIARMELQKENPDMDVARGGFLQGHLHPDDIGSVIMFFRRFQHIAYMSRAIEHWTMGDRLIAELNGVAETLHEGISSGRATHETIRFLLTRLDTINQQVTVEEDQFSSTLAEASRWANDVSQKITYAAAFLFAVFGIALSWPIITRIRVTENALRESESELKVIMESVQTGIIIIDPEEHKIVDVNTLAARMIGAPKDRIIGAECYKFLCPAENGKCPITDLHQTFDHAERVLLTDAGERCPVINNVTTVVLRGKEHILESFIDITGRKRMEDMLKVSLAEKEALVQKLNELANHDGLTGLYNHRMFYVLIEDELARAQRFNRPVSLLMLDIDHFKGVNDMHGHQAGDASLKALGDLLSREARTNDRVCRYGGEEIAVILPESDFEAATNMAERMRAAVEAQPFAIGPGAPVGITVSIGVATWPAQADSVQALVAAADAAMYAAKQGGRNRVGCVVSGRNYSFDALLATRECVINIPTVDIAKQVVGIGNCSGKKVDKFTKFKLTPQPAAQVEPPLIAECYANLECKVADTRMVNRYNFFVLEVVKAWVDSAMKNPRTLHHQGKGVFIVAGDTIKLASRMK